MYDSDKFKVIDYIVIQTSATKVGEFEAAVMSKINQGYIPIGGVSSYGNTTVLQQALVKLEKK